MSRIPIPPVVRPPVEPKVFDAMWVTSVVTETPYPNCDGRCVITYKPMAIDGEILDDERRIDTSTLMQAVSSVPALQQAFGAILAAIIPLQTWINEQEALRNQPAGGESSTQQE